MLGGSKTRSCVLNLWSTILPQAFHDSDPSWHGLSSPAHNKITSLAQHLVQPKKICHSASHPLSCDPRTTRSDFSRIALIQDTCFRVCHASCRVDPPTVISDHKSVYVCSSKAGAMCCAEAGKFVNKLSAKCGNFGRRVALVFSKTEHRRFSIVLHMKQIYSK